MSAAEQWYCNRNFNGIDENGEPRKFTRGEPIFNVEEWPTFNSLKNISWIVAKPVPVLKPAQNVSEVKPAPVTPTMNLVETPGLEKHSCEVCNKGFKNTRALNTHKRSHK